MRLILTILFLWIIKSDAQIIMASPFYEPPNVASSFYGILDTVTGATAAYSVRRLSSTYTGSAYRVRRSSDNAEQDIGFLSNGDLDTASLKTFVGANSGFVTRWYDQSGNGYNDTMATAGNQPRVINAGTLDRQNGKPCVRFIQASSTRLAGSTVIANGGIMTMVAAVGSFASANQDFFGCRGATGGWQFIYRTSGTLYQFAHVTSGYTSSYSFGSIRAAGVVSFVSRASDQGLTYYANNNLGTLGGTKGYTTTLSPFFIGAAGTSSGTVYCNSPIMEIIIYTTDKSASQTTLQNSTKNYFSVY